MHRRSQHTEKTCPSYRQRHRQRRHQQSHTRPISNNLRGGGDQAVIAGGEERWQEKPDRATERGDGIGDAVDEHRPNTTRTSPAIESGTRDRQSIPTEHRDSERHKTDSDHDGRVLRVALDPRREVVSHQADEDEHRHEPSGQRRAHDERATDTGPTGSEVSGRRRHIGAKEEHQVGRQQHEPARIHRRHKTSEKRQTHADLVDGIEKYRARRSRSSAASNTPSRPTTRPSASTKTVRGNATVSRASVNRPSGSRYNS